MQELPIDQAQPGMVLAAPVQDAKGNVLVGAGTALTAMHLQRLKERGFKTVKIQAGKAAAEPTAPATRNAAPPGAAARLGNAPAAAPAPTAAAAAAVPLIDRFEDMFARGTRDELMDALRDAARPVVATRKG